MIGGAILGGLIYDAITPDPVVVEQPVVVQQPVVIEQPVVQQVVQQPVVVEQPAVQQPVVVEQPVQTQNVWVEGRYTLRMEAENRSSAAGVQREGRETPAAGVSQTDQVLSVLQKI